MIHGLTHHDVAAGPGRHNQQWHSETKANGRRHRGEHVGVYFALHGDSGHSLGGAQRRCRAPSVVVELSTFVIVENERRLGICLGKLRQCGQNPCSIVLPGTGMVGGMLGLAGRGDDPTHTGQGVARKVVTEGLDGIALPGHALIEQRLSRTGLLVLGEPSKSIVVEVIGLLVDPPTDPSFLEDLTHGGPVVSRTRLGVLQYGIFANGEAIASGEENHAVGIRARESRLVILVSHGEVVVQCVVIRQVLTGEVRHAHARISGSVPGIHAAGIPHRDVGGIIHFGGWHAHCVGAVRFGAERKHILVQIVLIYRLIECI
mmetsp:Transcript_26695/g.45736  ORF Transcript_26695/g.45736 Transcript_26695/m.45736 type:complete len:317 (-) Transcript_26695:204-1154(-)